MSNVTPIEKAIYLYERGYVSEETDVQELAKEIERKTKKLKPKPIVNDVKTVYKDNTKFDE